jgi:hypothetical protein
MQDLRTKSVQENVSLRTLNSEDKTELNLTSEHRAWNLFWNNGCYYQPIILKIDKLNSAIKTKFTSQS